ncbi:hypothetical protein EV360DRAFT_76125, partial [Lentinula raphanica]
DDEEARTTKRQGRRRGEDDEEARTTKRQGRRRGKDDEEARTTKRRGAEETRRKHGSVNVFVLSFSILLSKNSTPPNSSRHFVPRSDDNGASEDSKDSPKKRVDAVARPRLLHSSFPQHLVSPGNQRRDKRRDEEDDRRRNEEDDRQRDEEDDRRRDEEDKDGSRWQQVQDDWAQPPPSSFLPFRPPFAVLILSIAGRGRCCWDSRVPFIDVFFALHRSLCHCADAVRTLASYFASVGIVRISAQLLRGLHTPDCVKACNLHKSLEGAVGTLMSPLHLSIYIVLNILKKIVSEHEFAEPFTQEWKGIDVQRIGMSISNALANRVKLQCSAEALALEDPAKRKALIKASLGKITQACVITDCQDIALVYYFPKILSFPHQQKIFHATSFINMKLYRSLVPETKKPAWRVNEKNFVMSLEYPLKPSVSLHEGNDQDLERVRHWLDQIEPIQLLSNLLLAFLHPELYAAGLKTLNALRRQGTETNHWATEWHTIFTCLCVSSSRISPAHRDGNGDPRYFDILCNLGCSEGAELQIEELDAIFEYAPGTAVLFSGKLWTHAVPYWKGGERVVYAYFMRPEVLNRFLDSPVGWARLL